MKLSKQLSKTNRNTAYSIYVYEREIMPKCNNYTFEMWLHNYMDFNRPIFKHLLSYPESNLSKRIKKWCLENNSDGFLEFINYTLTIHKYQKCK